MKKSPLFLVFTIVVIISLFFTSNIFATNLRYEFSPVTHFVDHDGDGGQNESGVRFNKFNTSIIESVVSNNGYVELININPSANSSIVEITDAANRTVHRSIVFPNVKHRVNVSILSEGSYTIKVLDLNNRILKKYVLTIRY